MKAIIWGRCVNDTVRKFLQFQISTNITAVMITFVSAVALEWDISLALGFVPIPSGIPIPPPLPYVLCVL